MHMHFVLQCPPTWLHSCLSMYHHACSPTRRMCTLSYVPACMLAHTMHVHKAALTVQWICQSMHTLSSECLMACRSSCEGAKPLKLSICGASQLTHDAVSALLRLPILIRLNIAGCNRIAAMDRMRLIAKIKAGREQQNAQAAHNVPMAMQMGTLHLD
jgi:hypothetical protein